MQNGPLTSRLHLREGDPIVVSKKPTGTLVLHDLRPGKHLYLLSTGTGLAPFMSVIQDPEAYERFDKIVLIHGVRHVSQLAYTSFITEHLPKNEFFRFRRRRQADLLPDGDSRAVPQPGPHHRPGRMANCSRTSGCRHSIGPGPRDDLQPPQCSGLLRDA